MEGAEVQSLVAVSPGDGVGVGGDLCSGEMRGRLKLRAYL
jgi:hypothetical protein